MNDNKNKHPRTSVLLSESEQVSGRPGKESGNDTLGQRLANAEAALEQAGVGCWEWQIGTEHVAWTPIMEQLWGLAPGSFKGTLNEVAEPILAEDLQRWQQSVQNALEQGIEHRIEMRILLPDGTLRWIEAIGNVIRDENGTPVRMMGTAMDITEHKKSEREKELLHEQLAQSQKMESIGRLAGGVAHDFNNLLQAILGNAELLQLKLPKESELRGHVEQILSTGERSAELTRQLLAFARKQTVAPVHADLNILIQRTLTMLQRLIGENIQVNWEAHDEPLPVHVDTAQMDQILTNVILNARDAIGTAGSITIRTSTFDVDQNIDMTHPDLHQGSYARLTIEDNGQGIDESILDRVFEPFFTTKKMGEGTGLGLAMVYGAVRQNDGEVSIASVAGEGTCVTISLPLHTALPTESGRVTSEEDDDAAIGDARVLVIEDEQSILGIIRDTLEHKGYQVLTAASPTEALSIWQTGKDKIDLVLTDVIMPEMNGEELIDRFRESNAELKCIYMSGYPADVIAAKGLLNPGINFIHKPFNTRALTDIVRHCLHQEASPGL